MEHSLHQDLKLIKLMMPQHKYKYIVYTLWCTLGLGQIFVNNFLNNRQLLKIMGFSIAQGSSAHTQCVLEIENFMSCDMNLWSNGGST